LKFVMLLEPVSSSLAAPIVAAALAEFGLVAEVVACDPTLADTAAFCEAYGVSANDSANTIVVIGKGPATAPEPQPLAACLVLATTRLDVNSAVKRQFGSKKASFASQDLACEVTGMEYGGVTAVGLPVAMSLWIDAAVMARTSIIIGGGNRSTKLRLNPAELLKLPNVVVVDGLAKPPQDS
jgi:prolyl-tRNA editing enzyme YbaK/EbsC (Cys-tRNA(Pro) deacylase)